MKKGKKGVEPQGQHSSKWVPFSPEGSTGCHRRRNLGNKKAGDLSHLHGKFFDPTVDTLEA
jgi:hypothetical protein